MRPEQLTTARPTSECLNGSCTIWGDPHISGFDKSHISLPDALLLEVPHSAVPHEARTSVDTGDVWLVKNFRVRIQGRYALVPSLHNKPFLRAIAIGGPFLDGNTLLVEPTIGRVLWNKLEILPMHEDNYTFQNSLIRVVFAQDFELVQDTSKWGPGLQLDLPLHIRLLVSRQPETLSLRIILPGPLEDGLDGECGNYNGDPADDTVDKIRARLGHGIPALQSLFSDIFNPLTGLTK